MSYDFIQPAPERRRKTDFERISEAIYELTSDEPSSVTIHHANPDFNGQPNYTIDWCDELTGYYDEKFTGDTLLAALQDAMRAKELRKLSGKDHPTDRFPGERGDAGKLERIAQLLAIMSASAQPIDEGEQIVGYRIKTGALHTVYGVLASAGFPVEHQLPGNPDPLAIDTQSVQVLEILEAAKKLLYMLKPYIELGALHVPRAQLLMVKYLVARLERSTG